MSLRSRKWPAVGVVCFSVASAVYALPAWLGLSLRLLSRGPEFFDLSYILGWDVVWTVQLASLGVLGSAGLLLLWAPRRIAWICRAWWGSSVALALAWFVVNVAWLGSEADRSFAPSEAQIGELASAMGVLLSLPSALLAIFPPMLGEWWRATMLAESSDQH